MISICNGVWEMMKTERKVLLCLALVTSAFTVSVVASPTSVTVASFADPSKGALEPLFVVDYGQGTLNGGWSSTGLTLEVPIAGISYTDVTFTMDQMSFSGASNGGYYTDQAGEIPYAVRFFDGDAEVVTIEFGRIWIEDRNSGLDAQDFYSDNVTISGIGFGALSVEHFGFMFTNINTTGDVTEATASFTSSAVPEPATIALLVFGGLGIRACRKKSTV
jgi:hypothetical protein